MNRPTARITRVIAIVVFAASVAGCASTGQQASSASTEAFVRDSLQSYGVIGRPQTGGGQVARPAT